MNCPTCNHTIPGRHENVLPTGERQYYCNSCGVLTTVIAVPDPLGLALPIAEETKDYGEADITDLLMAIPREGPSSSDAMFAILRHQSRCWEILASGRHAENFPGRVQNSRNLLAVDLREIIEHGRAS